VSRWTRLAVLRDWRLAWLSFWGMTGNPAEDHGPQGRGKDDTMAYEYDEDARNAAAKYPATVETIERLGRLCRTKTKKLGPTGVRGHTTTFVPATWEKAVRLPDSVPLSGKTSRGDVLDIGKRVREGTSPATDLLIASFIWGWGATGYGPSRLRSILEAAGAKLEPSLQRALAAGRTEPEAPDPIAGYAQLYGGYLSKESDKRAAPGAPDWTRLRGYGPAFFTKFLYFALPGALILDNRLANAVHNLSGLPNLVTADGRSWPWTPYRYAVYLHWMRQIADAVDVEPDLLELTLFQPPGDIADEHDAAD
jgi:hypothetical protein